jgi:hypothetical protein
MAHPPNLRPAPEQAQPSNPSGRDPTATLTVLERVVSGRTKAHELERLLPWSWKAQQLVDAVNV